MPSDSGGVRGRLAASALRAGELVRSPWVAYPAIVLLQMKVLWGAWIFRDLTQGDTASYFQRALLWHRTGRIDLNWSPLYTAFYAWCYGITGDVYAATVLHRVLIVVLATLLVLALFRRLVSPGVAWLAAAWWAVIPYNFDVFEVHVFAVLPLVAAPLAVLAWPGPRGRGLALALMAAAAVLVRNEMAVVALLLAAVFLAWELRFARRSGAETPPSARALGLAYGVPLAVSAAAVLFFVSRSAIPLSELRTAYAPKHTINMCQSYAFGYKQRHPEWTKNHWTECSELMQARFGEPYPTLRTMLARNPRAVLGHFAWNLRLLPAGLQLSLFSSMSGGATPDYGPVPVKPGPARVLSGLLAALLAAGLVARARAKPAAAADAGPAAAVGWLALVPAAAVALLLIVPTQRPRPEYLYGLSLPIVAAAAWAADVLLGRLGLLARAGFLAPVAMACALIAAPRYYVPPGGGAPVRPLLDTLRRLEPFQALISDPRTVLAAGPHSFSLSGYLVWPDRPTYAQAAVQPLVEAADGRAPRVRPLVSPDLADLRDDGSPESFLGERGVNLVYLDEATCRAWRENPAHARFLASLGTNGWKTLAGAWPATGEWLLIGKARPGPP
jgi:hypothetical protein